MIFPEHFRFTAKGSDFASEYGDEFGLFVTPRCPLDANRTKFSRRMKMIATNGVGPDGVDTGWEHVSVSLVNSDECPTWEEMCLVKSMFWTPRECVIQYHPPESDYINRHPGCLHLWRSSLRDIPTPPTWMV